MFKDLIEFMAKSLVDIPEAVRTEEVEDDRGSVIKLYVAKEDMGHVIGKNGRTAMSMRSILSVASTRTNRQTLLKIME